MKSIKRYLISTLIVMILMLGFAFILNTLNYFNVLNNSLYRLIILLFVITSTFTGSYYLGKKTEAKGYQKGIVFGVIIVTLFILLTLLFKNTFTASSIIYYIIIIITSTIGSTIGINKKTTETNQ